MIAALIILALGSSPSGSPSSDTLQLRADQAERAADSLRAEWDLLWKRSDSLRIESMLLRMKSNQLRKQAAALRAEIQDTTPPTPSSDELIMASVMARAAAVRGGKQRSGQTLSDTITAEVMKVDPDEGIASYYADAFHGKKTSSGEVFNMHDSTCAHRWLPFGTRVRVTNLDNGKEVIVRVNDRGPFHHGRLIDMSKGAAHALGMIRNGTARVRIEVVPAPSPEDDSTETEP